MSSEATPTPDIGALARRLEELEGHTNAMLAAARGAQRMRRLIGVLFLILLVSLIIRLVTFKNRLVEDMPKYADAIQVSVGNNMGDVTRELEAFYKHSSPVLEKAFRAQVEKDMQTYMEAVAKQRDELSRNLQNRIEKALEQHHTRVLEQHQAILREEFPEIKDEKAIQDMTHNFQEGVRRLVKKYYAMEFRRQIERTFALLEKFPMADPPKQGDQPLEKQLVGHAIELLKIKLIKSEREKPQAERTRRSAG